MIIYLDIIAFLSVLMALFFFFSGLSRISGQDIKVLLALLLASTLLYIILLLVEWSNLSHLLEKYEDFIGALVPMIWAFVFYAFFQKGINDDLIKSNEKLRITLNSIADGVIATTVSGSISRMNPTAEKLTGWKKEDANGKLIDEVFKIVHSYTREKLLNPVQQVLATKSIVRISSHALLLSLDGAEYHIEDAASPIKDKDGQMLGAVLIFRDVSEQYDLREQIIDREKRMDLALKGADLATWDWNIKTGEIIANERWAEMLGYTLDEIYMHIDTWEKMVHPDDFPEVNRILNEHLEGKRELYECEHRLRHKNGKFIWILDKGRVIEYDKDGKPLRACGTHLEITERKINDEHMRQSHKMEAVGRLAAGVAHDLNNLLTPILGYGELLTENDQLGSEPKNFVNQIMHAGFRARDLVRQLLAFSRKQTMQFESIDINETVNNFQKLLRRTIPENIEIKIQTSPDLAPVKADIGQIEQIIMNLMVNASDSMPEGGIISIETTLVEIDQDYIITHPNFEPGRYILLSISDTGCGMDQEILDHVFEPFFSTKGEQGTGLGLATVFGIIKQHNGQIQLYSEPQKGTTFKIYLPIAEKFKSEKKKTEFSGDKYKGTETILLVEDNEQVRHLAQSILERQGYNVFAAMNGDEALSLLENHDNSNKIDLLLTDVIMPGMNGRELYEQASKIYSNIKVLYMSGFSGNIIANHGVLDEGVQFISKPFSVSGLVNKVRELLN